jgi:SpoU rRNA methylase family enzyme
MRLLIVGSLGGHIAAAGKIALDRGAKVAQVDDLDGALKALRGGQGADLLMVEVTLDIARLITQLKSERISVPVVACGIDTNTSLAVEAIRTPS